MAPAPRLSSRYHRVRPTTASELAREGRTYAQLGRHVVNLQGGHLPGQMDHALRKVGAEAWREGRISYTEGNGLPELRDAVLDWLDLRDVRSAENVLIAAGSRSALSAVLAVITSAGDVVLVDAAAWSVFHPLVSAGGATPVPIIPNRSPHAVGNHFKLTPGDVRRQLQLMPGARAVLLANPVNPTAQLYSADEIVALVEACAQAGAVCIIDRLYGKLLYDGVRYPYLPSTPAVRDYCVLIDGVSRAFRGAGGLRVGWACGPLDIIEAAGRVQTVGMGPAHRVDQLVALAAISAPYDIGLIEELQNNRDMLHEAAQLIPELVAWPVAGTMFCMLDVRKYRGRTDASSWVVDTSAEFADYLLTDGGVLVAPGDIVGQEGFIRVAFSRPAEEVAAGMARIALSLERLQA